MAPEIQHRKKEISPDLVRRAQAGDERAQERLIAESRGIIHSAIWKTMSRYPPEDDFKDIVQEIHLKILEKLEDLRMPETYPKWVFTLSTNYCRDLQKKKREERFPEQSSDPDELLELDQYKPLARESQLTFETEQDALDAKFAANVIERGIPSEHYQLLLQHHGLELSLDEILTRTHVKKTSFYDRIKVAELHAILAKAVSEQRVSNYPEVKGLLTIMLSRLGYPEKSTEKRFLYASALSRLGDVLQLQGSVLGPDQSLDRYERAARVWHDLHDEPNALHAIHMIGLCHNILNENERAIAILGEIEERYKEGGPRMARALGNVRRDLGSVYLKVGQISTSKRYIEQSIPLLEDENSAGYRAAIRKLGEAHQREGNPDAALTLLHQSMHRVPSDQALLYTQGYVALCDVWLSLGKMGQALSCATEGKRIAEEHGFTRQLTFLNHSLTSHGLV